MRLQKETKHILLYRRLFLITYDMIAVIVSGIFALAIRYDLHFWEITPEFMDSILKYIPFNIVTMLIIFYIMRLYHSLWEYAGVTEMQNSVVGSFLVALFQFFGMWILGYRTPRSYPFLFAMLFIMLTVISRFSYRFLRTAKKKYQNKRFGQNVMIIGAGAAANMLMMTTAIVEEEQDFGYADMHWEQLEVWADYLQKKMKKETYPITGLLDENDERVKCVLGLAAYYKLIQLKGNL